jgi:hypothetical protein
MSKSRPAIWASISGEIGWSELGSDKGMGVGRLILFSLLPQPVFFVFQLGLEYFALLGELVSDGLGLFRIIGHPGELAVEGDFAFGDFGGVFGVQFREFFFDGGGDFDGGGRFIQAFHRQFK